MSDTTPFDEDVMAQAMARTQTMKEIVVIDTIELDGALQKVESLLELSRTETTLENAQQKKATSIELSKLQKMLDAKRQDATKPALEEQRRINGIFKPVLDKLDQMSKGLIKQVDDFVRAEQKREQARLAQEAKESAENIISGKPVDALPRPVSPNVTVSTTKFWTYQIVEKAKLSREYLKPDDAKIQAAIKSGVRSIPGLKIFEETRVTRR